MADEVLIRIQARDNASGVIRQVNSALGSLAGATGKATAGTSKYGRALGGVQKGAKLAVGSLFSVKGAVLGVASALSIQKVIAYGDAWTQTSNRLKLVQKEGESLHSTNEKLFRLAQESRGEFNATAGLYGRLARVSARLNMNQKDLMTVTETVGKAFTISGAGAQEMQAAIIQLGQGLASARLSGDELRSVLEQAPRLAQAIAEGLGTHVGELRRLGSEGKLTGEAVIQSILSQSKQIRSEFEQTTGTVAQGMVKINNAIQRFVGHLDMQLQFTAKIRERLQKITDVITVEVTAAIAVIPQAVKLIGDSFTLLKTVALDAFKRIFNDPIGFIGDLVKFQVKAFSTAVKTLFKIMWQWATAVWGPDGIIIETFKFMSRALINDWDYIFKVLVYSAQRIFLHPLDVAFKEVLLGMGQAISFFNEEWGKSIVDWTNKTMERTLALGKALKPPTVSEETTKALDDYVDKFVGLGDVAGENFDTLIEGLMEIGSHTIDLTGMTDEQKAAFEALAARARELAGEYKTEVDKAREANKALKEEAEDTAGMEAAGGRLERMWRAIGKAIRESAVDALKGAKAGLKEYEKGLMSVEQFTAQTVQNTLESLQSGFKQGFDVLIFGRQDLDATKDALKFLTDPLGTGQSLSDIITDTGADLAGGAQAGPATPIGTYLSNLREFVGEFADDPELTKKLRDRFTEIERALTGLVADPSIAGDLAKSVDDLFSQLESQTGFLGRMRGFGQAIKDELSRSLRDDLTTGLANATMDGLLGFADWSVKGIAGWLAGSGGQKAKDSMAKVGEELGSAGASGLGTIDAPYLIEETVVTGLKEVDSTVGNIRSNLSEIAGKAYSFTVNALGTAWEKIGQLSEAIFKTAGRTWKVIADAGGTAWEKISKLSQAIGKTASRTWNITADAGGNAWEKVGQLSESIGKTLGRTWNITANAGGDAWSKVTELSKTLGFTVGKTIKITAEKAGEAWGATSEFVNKVFSVTAEKATHMSNTAWGATKEFTNKVFTVTANKASRAANTAWGATQEFTNKVFKAIANTDGPAWDAIGKFVDKAFDVTATIVEKGSETVWAVINDAAKIIERAAKFTATIFKHVDSPQEIWDAIKTVGGVIERVAKFATEVVKGATPENLWKVLTKAGEKIEGILEFTSDLLKGDTAQDVWNVIKGVASKISTVMEITAQFSVDTLENVADTLKGVIEGSDVSSSFGEMMRNGLIAANFASIFAPNGVVGSAIGAMFGTVLGEAVGDAFGDAELGADLGAIIGSTAGNIIQTILFPQSSLKSPMQKFAGQQLSAAIRSQGGMRAILGEGGMGAEGFMDFLQRGGFTQAEAGISGKEGFLKDSLTNMIIGSGIAESMHEARAIVERMVTHSRTPGGGAQFKHRH